MSTLSVLFWAMKIVFHNVQSADYGRLEEVSEHTETNDIVVCIGTGKAAHIESEITQCQLPHHRAIQFGWKK
eukprot:932881-Pyramimonas_sp.AAC.1